MNYMIAVFAGIAFLYSLSAMDPGSSKRVLPKQPVQQTQQSSHQLSFFNYFWTVQRNLAHLWAVLHPYASDTTQIDLPAKTNKKDLSNSCEDEI